MISALPKGFLKTNIEYALKHNDVNAELTHYIIALAEQLKTNG